MKAHQRLIREQRAAEGSDVDLFGSWWERLDLDLGKARVRRITYATAKRVIKDYEWLGTMPAIVWETFGLYLDDVCASVVCYGPEYGENLGLWDSYGFTGSIIMLSRGASVHWAPPNAASKLIRVSMRMLDPRFEVVTATVDSAAGEVGTIYQACGFLYAPMNTHARRGIVVGGKKMTSRALRAATKTAAFDPSTAEHYTEHPKGRYFAFRANAAMHRAAIEHLIRPYPKRPRSIENDAPGNPVGNEDAVKRSGGSITLTNHG